MTSVHTPSNPVRPAIRGDLTAIEPRGLMNSGTDDGSSSSDLSTETLARERLMLLSSRERDVLSLIVLGLTNKATSMRLGISIKTVEKHRGNLMKKLRVLHIPDLMRVWLQAHPEELTMTR